MAPSANADFAFEGMGGLEKPFKNESPDVDRFFSPGFDAGDCGSLGFGHVAHPADSARNFFEIEGLPVDFVRLPIA